VRKREVNELVKEKEDGVSKRAREQEKSEIEIGVSERMRK
jgi:hypothetical protein